MYAAGGGGGGRRQPRRRRPPPSCAAAATPPAPHRLLPGLVCLLLFVVAVALSGVASAAEWAKLKTCADAPFCRRHRHGRAGRHSSGGPLSLAAGTLAVAPDGLSVRGTLVRPAGPDVALAVSLHTGGVWRLVLDDVPDGGAPHPRFRVGDISLVDAAAPLPLGADSLRVEADGGGADVLAPGVASWVRLSTNPLRVALMSPDGVEEVVVNGRGLLRMEPFVKAPAETPTPAAEESAGGEVAATAEASPVAAADDPLENVLGDDDDDDLSTEERAAEDTYQATAGAGAPSPPLIDDTGCDGCGSVMFKSHADPQPRGAQAVAADIFFPGATSLHGLPGRTLPLSLPVSVSPSLVAPNVSAVTEPVRLYNLDVFEYELDKPLGLYGAIPLVYARSAATGRTVGALWLNAAETFVDIADGEVPGKDTHWMSESGVVELFLLPGGGRGAADVYEQYLGLTGRPALPPAFALGKHQCRWNYRDDADARSVNAGYERHGLPYDVLWLDIEHTDGKRYFTWDTDKFPDPTALMAHLDAHGGRQLVTIVDPHIKRDDGFSVHADATAGGHYVKNAEGADFDGWCWAGSSSYIDYLAPTAREFWASRFCAAKYPHFGPSLHTWVDMNEPSVFNGPEGTLPKHALHAGGWEHRDVHNVYGILSMAATADGLRRGHGPTERPFSLSRSYFAGSHRHSAVWTGDNTASFPHLASTVRMLLALQLGGISLSGADVGGFFGNPDAELMVRWYAVAIYQPFLRNHAHMDTARREPWVYSDATTDAVRVALRERYALLPYWRTLFAANSLGGPESPFADAGPPMRPVWWAATTAVASPDPTTSDAVSTPEEEVAWYVGRCLYIPPVLEAGVTTATTTLPGPSDARWYDTHSPASPGTPLSGGTRHTVDAPVGRLLAYAAGGCVVPRAERARRSTAAAAADPLTLAVYLDAAGAATGEWVAEDGKTTAAATAGAYTLVRYTAAAGELRAATAGGQGLGGGVDPVGVERVVLYGAGRVAEGVWLDVAGETWGERPVPWVDLDTEGGVVVKLGKGVPATGWKLRWA